MVLNPIAPPVYGGLTTPDGPVDYTYPLNVTVGANATVNAVVPTNTDANFRMMVMILNVYTSLSFSIAININGVYPMQNLPILGGNIVSDPSSPYVILGQFEIPRGANINVQITDLSGATNAMQLLFRGQKMYGKGA